MIGTSNARDKLLNIFDRITEVVGEIDEALHDVAVARELTTQRQKELAAWEETLKQDTKRGQRLQRRLWRLIA